jgi:hypothetical protein
LGSLAAGDTYNVIGKNAAGDWLEFVYERGAAWVTAAMVTVNGNLDTVEVAQNIPAPSTVAAPQPQPTSPPNAAPTSPARAEQLPLKYPAPVLLSPDDWASYSKHDEITFSVEPHLLAADEQFQVEFVQLYNGEHNV